MTTRSRWNLPFENYLKMSRITIGALLLVAASSIQNAFCFGTSGASPATFTRSILPSNLKSIAISRSDEFKLFASAEDASEDPIVDMGDVGFVLLAGGTGSRMKANMPKQFLTLRGKPVLQHSLDLFLTKLPTYLEDKGAR